jgi:hypothetical protein
MLNIIKKSIQILKYNLLFIQPLILFIFLILGGIAYISEKIIPMPAQIVLLISGILLFIAFIAGWFHINKLAVKNYNAEDSLEEYRNKAINNFKKFFEGVGGNFLKVLFAFGILSVLSMAAGYGIIKFCMAFYGKPDILFQLPKIANAVSQAERLNIINSISLESQITLAKWFFTLNTASIIATFLYNMFFVIVIFENENVFKSIIRTLKFIFKNFWNCIVIIIFLQFLYILLNIISMLFGMNAIALFITILLFTMYLNYGVILLFCFYDEKSKDNSNNGTECLGENEIIG